MNEIESLAAEILGLTQKLVRLRSAQPGEKVSNRSFETFTIGEKMIHVVNGKINRVLLNTRQETAQGEAPLVKGQIQIRSRRSLLPRHQTHSHHRLSGQDQGGPLAKITLTKQPCGLARNRIVTASFFFPNHHTILTDLKNPSATANQGHFFANPLFNFS
ncbi:MAG: hypothetical protein ACI8UZ_000350 [Akkermansiaceae bacterium]